MRPYIIRDIGFILVIIAISLFNPCLFGCKGTSSPAPKKTKEVRKLLPIKKDGKWGYIDKTGKIVIKPQFEYAYNFSEGLAVIGKGRKTSYSCERYGYIDENGEIVIETIFDYATPFHNGLAEVEINKNWGVIDKRGEWVIKPLFHFLGEFSEGLALAKVAENEKYCYIDKFGTIVIKPQDWGWVQSFSEGLARIEMRGYGQKGKQGYIDKTGKIVIEPQFEEARCFSEGLAAVYLGYDKGYAYIDKTGSVVMKPKISPGEEVGETGDFSEGLAWVSVWDSKRSDKKYGYIDKTGQFVIKPQFDGVLDEYNYEYNFKSSNFSEGLAFVGLGEKAHCIDKQGNIVITLEYPAVGSPFSGGVAQITVGPPSPSEDEKIGYIDKTGKYIWEPTE